MTPMERVRPVERARAVALGPYPSSATTSRTRLRVASLTDAEPLMTRETVPTPTPASCATLAIVVTSAPPRGTASIQSRRGSACQRSCGAKGSYPACLMSAEPTTRPAPREGGEDVAPSWWRDGVLYQIYPRSFADSDGDGIGDLRGIAAHLDHLEWLGVDGIWLNPTFPSPNEDWGYDVSDYTAVHPDLGTMADLEALIAEAGRRGIRVLLDLVPNHTSDQHAWFQDALTGRDARYRDFYVWGDPAADGGPPNNWISNFGGSAWTLHEPTGQYYLNQFLPTQPDLNWWNEELREAIDEVLEFWFDRGVAGFRIDVCHAIVKDAELRDDPEPGPDDHPHVVKRGLKQVYSMNRPELHDVLRRWRALTAARDGDEPVLAGETYVLDLEQLVPL